MLTVVLVAMAMAAPGAETSSVPAIYRPIPGCDTTVLVYRPADPIERPPCINAAAERRRDRLQCGAGPDTTCFAATSSRRGAP